MKEVFAKIIETANHQVLVIKNFNESEGLFEMEIQTEFGGNRTSLTHTYVSEEKRDDHFNVFNINKAEGFVQGMKAIYT